MARPKACRLAVAMATPRLRRTGLSLLGDLPWGSHACHLFQTRSDLLETLIPFFKAGLEGRELCLWVIHAPLTEAVSRRALEQRIPDAERHLAERSIGSCRAVNGISRAPDSRRGGCSAPGTPRSPRPGRAATKGCGPTATSPGSKSGTGAASGTTSAASMNPSPSSR